MTNKTFNLYCDESNHLENDGKKFMLISYIRSPINQVDIHHDAIREIKKRHNFKGEIKWTNVSRSQFHFYADIIDYFFSTDLTFRAVVVNKQNVRNDAFNQDFQAFYYKMYYQVIYHKLDLNSCYNIYLDIKDTLSAKKVRTLKDVLQIEFSSIRNVQNIRSDESLLMQMTDLIMGAISYHLNFPDGKVLAKKNLIDKIRKNTDLTLNHSTPRSQDKLNLFFIDLKQSH